MTSDKIPGTLCHICGEPTDWPFDGAQVYHAECLAKQFPNSNLHKLNNQIDPKDFEQYD